MLQTDNASDWQEPSSIKEAETRKDKTLSRLFNIDAQLNSRNLTSGDGSRLDSASYQSRKNELLREKTRELRELKKLRNWIKSERLGSSNGANVMSDTALLKKAYTLFLQLKDDGVDFEDAELEFIDVLAARVGG